MKNYIKDLIISAVLSLIVFAAIIFFLSLNDKVRTIYVMNACFATSALMIVQGLFTYINNSGGFDALKYASRTIIKFYNHENYGDYKEKMSHRTKKQVSPSLIIGGIYLLISIILTFVVGF